MNSLNNKPGPAFDLEVPDAYGLNTKELEKLQEEIVAMRRDLHRIPEIGFDLSKTAAYVRKKLDEYKVPYEFYEDINGIVAKLAPAPKASSTPQTSSPEEPASSADTASPACIAFRADMDGLMIKEDTGLPFASVHEGRMHACGHDAHTAMLLGAAKYISEHRDLLDKEVRFIFQPYEEGVRGGRAMVERGAMEGVDAVFGIHIGTLMGMDIPTGTLVIVPGPIMASSDVFHITVHGSSCHASTPEKGIDPINIASHIVIGLNEIVTKEFSPLHHELINVCSIAGGTQHNIVPDEVRLTGTTRAYDNETRTRMEKRIGEISKSMAAAFGGTIDYDYRWGCDPVVNDPGLSTLTANMAKALFGADHVLEKAGPLMAAEDFSAYQKKAMGVLVHLSTADASKGTACPHHNPHFDIDEDQLWRGSVFFASLALRSDNG